MKLEFKNVIGKLYPQRAKGVEPDKIPWDNEDYEFQVKEDGDRRLLYFTKDKVYNTSRSKGADTGLPVDKTDNVPHIRDLNIPYLEGTIIDCEFIHNRGFQDGVRKIMGCLPEKAIQRQEEWGLIEVYVFDIISYKGTFLHESSLKHRLSKLEEVYNTYFKDIAFFHMVKFVHGTKEEKMAKFNEIVASGGEGFVAKNIYSTYRLSTEKCLSPLKNAWIKVKREFNGDFVIMGFDEPTEEYTGDHLDMHAYWQDETGEKMMLRGMDEAIHYTHHNGIPTRAITEFYYKNWIGAIRFGEHENGILVERGSVTGITKQLRAELSSNPEKYIGKVIEIDAMQRTKDKALRQPVFKGFRSDKLPEDCIYENQKG
jgi:ATP-dependent DNA ligase